LFTVPGHGCSIVASARQILDAFHYREIRRD
jgi:hypothetical protein